MKIVEPLTYSSLEELKSDIQKIKTELKTFPIVGVRGLKISKDEQLQLAKDLGDLFNWTPNNTTEFKHEYTENHSTNPQLEKSLGQEIMLNWHLEHVDYDNYSPLVVGVWNMYKYTCSPEVGMTYFIDSREIYSLIYTEDEKSFLRNCIYSWLQPYPNDLTLENTAKIVSTHWLDGREQIRLEMHHLSTLKLLKYENSDPTEDQKNIFNGLVARFVDEVYSNEDLRIVHKWQEGDILIPDLYALAHAVTGGFSPEEREFSGYWCYLNSPENLNSSNAHPSWS